jgi:hypothetical protein
MAIETLDLRAVSGCTQGAPKYQRVREYWKRRIQQVQKQITQIEAKLKTE